MNKQEALAKMIAPGTRRPGKYLDGVLQIWITRACDKACYNCTQGSNLGGKPRMMSLEHFEQACKSLRNYFGVVGVFGGNPAIHPQFPEICEIMRRHIPWQRRGLWCNNPLGHGKVMRQTFNPRFSNLNVHMDHAAYNEFKMDWPECIVIGLDSDSRHSPPFVAIKDVIPDEGKRWELISGCDINIHWSALIGVFRGQLRAWFCEIAGAQSMLHQDEPDYPDTGHPVTDDWWCYPMSHYEKQVEWHCHRCGIPLRGYGELAMAKDGKEQVSAEHQNIYRPKKRDRKVELVTTQEQLGKPLELMVTYLQNSKK
jgi:hypothetical protein